MCGSALGRWGLSYDIGSGGGRQYGRSMSGTSHGSGRRPSVAMMCRSGTTAASRSARKNGRSGRAA
eukprot:4029844-Pleurochrysis_carterae.AAC.1